MLGGEQAASAVTKYLVMHNASRINDSRDDLSIASHERLAKLMRPKKKPCRSCGGQTVSPLLACAAVIEDRGHLSTLKLKLR